MSETRLAQVERRVSELEEQNRKLRRRMEQLLSRKGGHLEGQLHIDGWLQFEEQTTIVTPVTDLVRLGVLDVAGVQQMVVIFANGTIVPIAQE